MPGTHDVGSRSSLNGRVGSADAASLKLCNAFRYYCNQLHVDNLTKNAATGRHDDQQQTACDDTESTNLRGRVHVPVLKCDGQMKLVGPPNGVQPMWRGNKCPGPEWKGACKAARWGT